MMSIGRDIYSVIVHTMYSYPYPSRLRDILRTKVEGVDFRIWQSNAIESLVASTNHPVIEIGGPTQDGYFFLYDVEFNTKPIITNISSNPLPFSPDSAELADQVDDLFDAIKMPYVDNSVGIFLMAAMSISSDWWVELPEDEKEKVTSTFRAEYTNARFEMGQVAAGILDFKSIKDAQRIKIYLEVHRCLNDDGLFFTDGGIEEIAILKRLGFEMLACLQVVEGYGMSYEFVVRKGVQSVN